MTVHYTYAYLLPEYQVIHPFITIYSVTSYSLQTLMSRTQRSSLVFFAWVNTSKKHSRLCVSKFEKFEHSKNTATGSCSACRLPVGVREWRHWSVGPGHRPSHRERDRHRYGHRHAAAGGTAHHTGRPDQGISRQRLLGRTGLLQLLHGKHDNKLNTSNAIWHYVQYCMGIIQRKLLLGMGWDDSVQSYIALV